MPTRPRLCKGKKRSRGEHRAARTRRFRPGAAPRCVRGNLFKLVLLPVDLSLAVAPRAARPLFIRPALSLFVVARQACESP